MSLMLGRYCAATGEGADCGAAEVLAPTARTTTIGMTKPVPRFNAGVIRALRFPSMVTRVLFAQCDDVAPTTGQAVMNLNSRLFSGWRSTLAHARGLLYVRP